MFVVIKWNERDKTIIFESLASLRGFIKSIYGYKGRIKDKTFLTLMNENTRRIAGYREDNLRIYKDRVDALCATELKDKHYRLKEFANRSGYVWYINITLIRKGA